MAGYVWTKEELYILQSCVGEVPWPMVTARYNYEATQHGYAKRTWAAIKHKCDHLKLSRTCIGEWIKATTVSEMLNVSTSTVARWIHGGKLEARQFKTGKKGSTFYIKRLWLRRFAKENPRLFGGLDFYTLHSLLDNELLAKELVAMLMPANTMQTPVLCVETGKRFESLSEAATATFISRWRINYAIKNPSKMAGGYHWQKL
jgi:hypothetical protein